MWSASSPRSLSSSSTSRNESEYRRYQRTAQRISSGSVCRHLKIAGRIVFFMIASGYQPLSAKVATQLYNESLRQRGDLVVTEDGALTVQTEIEPVGVLTISTHGRGDLLSGSVKVVSDGPIGGVLRFDLPEVGVAGVGASQPVSDAIVPVRRQQDGLNTGIAIHNLESSPELMRCALMQEGVLLDAANTPLAANGQDARFIDQMFPTADTSDFTGSVRCAATAGGLFTAVALEMDPGSRIFTTLPIVPVQR